MKLSRLLGRELGRDERFSAISAMYGDKCCVDDLDIVNELGGHSGCVNALTWSRSGSFLASGSDDTRLNIHAYQPESSTSPFALVTSISTGHTANIFSTKFMPHSGDHVLVSCAGDGEVRIFDIEHSSRSSIPHDLPGTGRRLGNNNVFDGVRYLSEADTDARVYRSHSDRVKRIVTESSPYLFLTCSEDGEVRQWDSRLPSSAYPLSRDSRAFSAADGDNASNVPPPLISYKRYRLDLNTISCSASQPHYIALGGAHLHCFLHDRRMLGRDRTAERGSPGSTASKHVDDELMGRATRCVRRFAPNGLARMKRDDNNHITACKISDANPNEMVVSWSGDWIYSFDLIKSADAIEQRSMPAISETMKSGKVKAKDGRSRERKRKRGQSAFSESPDQDRAVTNSRQADDGASNDADLALRVRYENGQSEDIPIEVETREAAAALNPISAARDAFLNDSHRRSRRIADAVVEIRRQLFGLAASRNATEQGGPSGSPSDHTASFTAALAQAAAYLPIMDEIMRTWRYPMDPSREEVALQQTLRRNRLLARQFVQAAGVLASILGGQLERRGGESVSQGAFHVVDPSPDRRNRTLRPSSRVRFCFDFLRAILAWLRGGRSYMVVCFTQDRDHTRDAERWPVPYGDNGDVDPVDEVLIPHLVRQAQHERVPNIDASPFERDERLNLYATELEAVFAFGNATHSPIVSASGEESSKSQLRAHQEAIEHWAFKVARGLLMNAAEGVNFAFVERAFGGLPSSGEEGSVPEESIEHGTSASPASSAVEGESGQRLGDEARPTHELAGERIVEEDEEDEGEEDEDEDGEDMDDDDDITMEDDEAGQSSMRLWASAFDRSGARRRVEEQVPCGDHSMSYSGHCNVKTVKDVNFWGRHDEYVVSGSDCGNLFIWDRKTALLMNILEGDQDVVNVVQGHPYEPMMAVSGIDDTIKIFSPDRKAQEDARKGINIAPAPSGGHSILGLGGRGRRWAEESRGSDEDEREDSDGGDGEQRDEGQPPGLRSRRRMRNAYEIISQNDVDRRGGMRDAYITVGHGSPVPRQLLSMPRRGMLAQLAARLREQPELVEQWNESEAHYAAQGPVDGADEECLVM